MVSVFVAALSAFALAPGGASSPPAALDLRCYRLMADLAADDDPRVSSAGLTGAQYFLGRIDARAPGFDPASAPTAATPEAEREQLLDQCAHVMGKMGHDFRAIGRRLVAARPTI